VGVEFFSMSKSFNMPGWRVGFAVGNPALVGALRKMKSYLDYGIFQPLQIASIVALNELEHEVQVICDMYQQRRDVLVLGLQRLGWPVQMPRGTMFVWAPIPEPYRAMGSLEFSKHVLKEAKVAVSPGIGFGEGVTNTSALPDLTTRTGRVRLCADFVGSSEAHHASRTRNACRPFRSGSLVWATSVLASCTSYSSRRVSLRSVWEHGLELKRVSDATSGPRTRRATSASPAQGM
jgi:hypothetical protein